MRRGGWSGMSAEELAEDAGLLKGDLKALKRGLEEG
jgi:hypothetical protein